MLSAIRSIAVLGIEAYVVIVEVDLAAGTPTWTITVLTSSIVRARASAIHTRTVPRPRGAPHQALRPMGRRFVRRFRDPLKPSQPFPGISGAGRTPRSVPLPPPARAPTLPPGAPPATSRRSLCHRSSGDRYVILETVVPAVVTACGGRPPIYLEKSPSR